ncbi:DUF5107 domain-containing protein [bacterium]|nr:DUF5107 domain-containing protein [bacterium]
MSTFRVETLRMPAADLGPDNPLPPLGRCLPHHIQDGFDRTKRERDFKVAVLENAFLRATFLLELGGRLWSLIHKPTDTELLYVNPVFQPGNLAIRNAWFSGGVEWNIGVRGHAAHTCSPLFAARFRYNDGTPGLRLYEWDRVRGVPFQLDAFLPDGSEFLFVRVRLTNPHDHEIPMYWWSNMAVPELPGGRVLVPAEQAYRYDYKKDMTLEPAPYVDGVDQSYPTSFRRSADSFYCIEEGCQPWIASLDEQGRGLVQTSTQRLRGRKMFVWGMEQGGRHWQEFLSVPDRPYIEIQAGLARTQMEYVPMPAGAEWTWLEAYGLMQAAPETAHGSDWRTAYESVRERLEAIVPLDALDERLAATAEAADAAPEELIQHGSGWGALERRRRESAGEAPFCSAALMFGDDSLSHEQAPWLELLDDGALPRRPPLEAPGASIVQAEWQTLLDDAIAAGRGDHWLSWLHRGIMDYHREDFDGARAAWERSLALEPSPWALRNLAVLHKREEEHGAAANLLLQASRMAPHVRSLALECCQALLDAGQAREMMDFMDALPPAVHDLGRMRILEARAALALGDLDGVERILHGRPVVPDIREGEVSLSNLWFELQEKRVSVAENIPIDDALRERIRRDFPPPSWLDFRQTTS